MSEQVDSGLLEGIASIASAIAWPILGLALLIVVVCGGLNGPLKSLSQSITGLFSGITTAKRELNDVGDKLREVAGALEPSLTKVSRDAEQIKKTVDDAISQLSEKMSSLEERLEKLNRTFIESQIAQAQDEGFGQPDETSQELLEIDSATAAASFKDIQECWGEVRTKLIEHWPGLSRADKRSLRDALDSEGQSVNGVVEMSEVKDDVASLHKRFRTYSRMQSTIDTWLTPELAKAYLDDARRVLGKLDAQ